MFATQPAPLTEATEARIVAAAKAMARKWPNCGLTVADFAQEARIVAADGDEAGIWDAMIEARRRWTHRSRKKLPSIEKIEPKSNRKEFGRTHSPDLDPATGLREIDPTLTAGDVEFLLDSTRLDSDAFAAKYSNSATRFESLKRRLLKAHKANQ